MFNNSFKDVFSELSDNSVHAVITDPPYGSGGFTLKDVLKTSKQKYVSSDSSYQKTLPNIDGDSLHPMAWQQLMTDACNLAMRVLVDGGVLAMFIDWRNLGALQNVIHSAGFTMRGLAVWDKNNSSRPMRNGMKNQAEYIAWATKGTFLKREKDVYLPGVFKYTTMTNGKVHITQKPIGLMRDLVELCYPDGVIFDPFMGSGTTGLAALESGRSFIGCESVDHYFDVAKNRLFAEI